MRVKLDAIYNMLNDGSMVGADFELLVDYNEVLEVGEDEFEVIKLDGKIYEECAEILAEEGFQITDSFIYYDKHFNTLTFEVELI